MLGEELEDAGGFAAAGDGCQTRGFVDGDEVVGLGEDVEVGFGGHGGSLSEGRRVLGNLKSQIRNL